MRERLAALDHARREFIANASHELRTPLFSLGGFLELLTDEELDEATRREFLATMREQVDRLAKLATELLDLSRADAGPAGGRARAGRPRAVAETVADEFAALARSGEHAFEFEPGRRPSVLATSSGCSRSAGSRRERARAHAAGTSVRCVPATACSTVEDDGPGSRRST